MRRFSRVWGLRLMVTLGICAILLLGLLSVRPGFWMSVRAAQTAPAPALDAARERLRPAGSYTQAPIELAPAAKTNGPLRVSTANPRYFSDSSGAIVYLTGSHTWSNLVDNGGTDPPPAFDYPAYLDFLAANGHNFFRLWTWEQSRWTVETNDDTYWFSPLPYQRTGPGTALDGKPRFDLTKFNQAYFDRLRERVIAARERGIYVAVMLFDGWSVADAKGGFGQNNPWRGHPFNQSNNINGINGDLNGDGSGVEVHELGNPAVTAIQEAYVRKVIDTVNDLDNVLYEISNESHGDSELWQYHMIELIRSYEAGLPAQHPIGMSVEYPDGDNDELFASSADWISINGHIDFPPEADGSKVLITDSDHICGICGSRVWVWKSFTLGHNPIFMDGYDGAGYGVGGEGFDFDDPNWVSLRKNLGYTLSYARRMNLAAMVPRRDLASSGFALANPVAQGAEYLVYLPEGGEVEVDLSAAAGSLHVEWLDPSDGTRIMEPDVAGGAERSFTPPFSGDAVLYIYHEKPASSPTPTASATARSATSTATSTVTSTISPTTSTTPGAAPACAYLPYLSKP